MPSSLNNVLTRWPGCRIQVCNAVSMKPATGTEVCRTMATVTGNLLGGHGIGDNWNNSGSRCAAVRIAMRFRIMNSSLV